MNLSLLLHTLRYLKIKQLYYQVYYRVVKRAYKKYNDEIEASGLIYVDWIDKPMCINGSTFCFLNITDVFHGWNDTRHGNLWSYNLNYMDWLLQPGYTYKEGSEWITCFIDDIENNKIGLAPYPTALRGINWIKFISMYADRISTAETNRWNKALWEQYALLRSRFEYHLLGNHLLEDAYSLYIAALYFKDDKMYRKSTKLLKRELKEQLLDDGAHYEQSPMYHCILLDRLLDCYNFSKHNVRFEEQEDFTSFLAVCASKMLGYLDSIIYSDGSIPLLNDSAIGIAPTATQLYDYAQRLGIEWQPMILSNSGYRHFKHDRLEVVIDIGDIMASYQPGHSHADTFNYELRIDGNPFIVDTGISTYEKNSRRQYERSTVAHNTVTIEGRDTSQVWGGFRVANRAKVSILEDTLFVIKAFHNGFGGGKIHIREFNIHEGLKVIDEVPGGYECISYIHFAPLVKDISVQENIIHTNRAEIVIYGAIRIELIEDSVSTEYNVYSSNKLAKIYFHKRLEYHIII